VIPAPCPFAFGARSTALHIFVRPVSANSGTSSRPRKGFTMSILVDCPGHGGSLHLPDTVAGKKVRCPKCQTVFIAPAKAPAPVATRPIPRPPVPAESETVREAKSSITTPDKRRRKQEGPSPGDSTRRRIAATSDRPIEKGSAAAQRLVLGMIVGCLSVLVLIAVAAILLTRGANRNSSAQNRGGRDKQPDPRKGSNLLVNGGFEIGPAAQGESGFVSLNEGSNAIQGWTVTRGSVDYIGPYWQHAEGQRSLDLNGMVRGGIAQTIKTTKGQRYRVTFSLSGNPTFAEGEEKVKTLGLRAGETSTTFTFDTTGRNTGDMGWVNRTWDFVASADHTTIEFYSLSGQSCGPVLDNVWVATPE